MKKIKTGFVGTGYIADYHATAIGNLPHIEIDSICELVKSKGDLFASNWGIPSVFQNIEILLNERKPDVIHVLTPPDTHFPLAKKALEAGCHVVLEKPMCSSARECRDLVALAEERGLKLCVSHNFLFYPVYQKLKKDIDSGILGRITQIELKWNRPLGFLDNGPYGIWMLREPGNIMLEIGSHPYSELNDLLGKPEIVSTYVSEPVILPGKKIFYKRWKTISRVDRTDVQVQLSFDNAFSEYSIHVRGTFGTATVDFEKNIYTSDFQTPKAMDFDFYARTKRIGKALRQTANRNITNYLLSKFRLSSQGNAYQYSIDASIKSFYDSLGDKKLLDRRIDGTFGADVISLCECSAGKADLSLKSSYNNLDGNVIKSDSMNTSKRKVLVLGGTGFIGRYLVEELLSKEYYVRVLTRQKQGGVLEIHHPNLEIVSGSMHNTSDLENAFLQVEYVYHLARIAGSNEWKDYYENDVMVTKKVGELALKHNVKRLIYTGSIDSFNSGSQRRIITEETPVDKRIKRRNLYGRCKAEGEKVLRKLQDEKGLPLVIMRPGIVIGKGSNPCHWGVGMWNGLGICQVWGKNDKHKLPFILVQDVAKGLLRGIEVEGIDGKIFNLIDKPLISAEEYLDALELAGNFKLQRFYTPILTFYLKDLFKWIIKVLVKHPGRKVIPSFRDWRARTHRSEYDCHETYDLLGWFPSSERDIIIDKGIREPLNEIM